MRLISQCDTSGHDINCYAIIELGPEIAGELLRLRGLFAAANAASSQIGVSWLDAVTVGAAAVWPEYFYVDAPFSDPDLMEPIWTLPGGEWGEIKTRRAAREPDFGLDIDRLEIREQDICWTCYADNIRITTDRLDWKHLEAIARGENPWAQAPAEAEA